MKWYAFLRRADKRIWAILYIRLAIAKQVKGCTFEDRIEGFANCSGEVNSSDVLE